LITDILLHTADGAEQLVLFFLDVAHPKNTFLCNLKDMTSADAEFVPQFVILLDMKTSDSLLTLHQGVPEPEVEHGRLLSAIAKGDEPALGAFYDVTVSRVYGLALRIVRRREAAEEVVEDVFMQVWRQANRFDTSRGKPLTWLLTICRSRALDFLRRDDEAMPHPEPETLVNERSDERANPPEMLLALERNTRLYAALESLIPVQRQLLALAFFRGMTHQEMADHTQIPLGTVKSHVRKALDKMREQLGEKIYD
jgi:RNA polymerase sigma factor (sigma-70 family)